MRDYRRRILEDIGTVLATVLWEELPEDTREFLGVYDKLAVEIEYPEFLQTEFPKTFELVIGFGDQNPDFWDGTIYWSIRNEFDQDPRVEFFGEIRNGSPEYVVWELFNDFNEQIKKGAN